MKLLFLDIETAPNIALTWGLWDQNIAINQIVEPGYTLCFSAKWKGKKNKVHFHSNQEGSAIMIKEAWNLLNEADLVCHYNGANFDIPTLKWEFMKHSLPPPAPFKQVDLLRTMRSTRIASRKLDYVCQQLGIGHKLEHKGMELWKGCMKNNAEDWKVMERYNRKDVTLLESLFNRIEPWIIGMPKDPTFCEHLHVQKRGFYPTAQSVYQRYHCSDCGKWIRDNKPLKKTKYKIIN